MAATWTAPVEVALTTDLSGGLSDHERAMLPPLLVACSDAISAVWPSRLRPDVEYRAYHARSGGVWR